MQLETIFYFYSDEKIVDTRCMRFYFCCLS